MTREELVQILAYLQVGSGAKTPVSHEQAEIYFDILGSLPFDLVQRAARLAVAESQYPVVPPVGVILKHCGVTVAASDRATLAYGAACRASRCAGGYRSVNFSDPIANAAVRAMGGWPRFTEWPTAELHWRQRDFERHYVALCGTGVAADDGRLLAGIVPGEVHHIAIGPPLSEPAAARPRCIECRPTADERNGDEERKK
jgi:hypothetical protein